MASGAWDFQESTQTQYGDLENLVDLLQDKCDISKHMKNAEIIVCLGTASHEHENGEVFQFKLADDRAEKMCETLSITENNGKRYYKFNLGRHPDSSRTREESTLERPVMIVIFNDQVTNTAVAETTLRDELKKLWKKMNFKLICRSILISTMQG